MDLRQPSTGELASYVAAIERGWSPDTMDPDAGRRDLAWIDRDADGFLASLTDPDARGAPVELPDGTVVPRIPSRRLWMWNGGFCGSIGLRWVVGTNELPPYVYGHIGYTVVPWERRRGHATAALHDVLPIARAERLGYVELTTDVDNVASQRVIAANGGFEIGRFTFPDSRGGLDGIRYRITLDDSSAG